MVNNLTVMGVGGETLLGFCRSQPFGPVLMKYRYNTERNAQSPAKVQPHPHHRDFRMEASGRFAAQGPVEESPFSQLAPVLGKPPLSAMPPDGGLAR